MAEALADLTTLHLGGPAGRLVTAGTEQELVAAVREADDAGTPLLVLGGGSNVVIGDAGFPGTVVRVATAGLAEDADLCSGASVTVAAGESWDGFVATAVARGWVGVEALSGIPGSVGGTPVQNVGAYGQEVADTIARVRTWDRVDRTLRTYAASDCGFGYRTSRFKQDRSATSSSTSPSSSASAASPLRSGTPSWPGRSACPRAAGRRWPRSAQPC